MFGIKTVVKFAPAAIALSITVATAADDSAVSSKEQMHRDMITLAEQMLDLKPQVEDSPAAAALYSELERIYQEMSDQLGGDDPGSAVLAGGSRRVTPAIHTPPADDNPRPEGGIAGLVVAPGCTQDSDLSSNTTNVNIPDVSTVTSTITKSGIEGRIWYVDSVIDIDHTFAADLDIRLTSPSGTTITITSDNGGEFDNVFNTFFRDDADPDGQVPYVTNNGLVTDHAYANLVPATPLAPEEPFHAFAGEDPNGTWTLTITDDLAQDTGFLDNWDLLIVTTSDPRTRTTRTFGATSSGPFGIIMPDNALFTSTHNVSGMGGYLCDVQVRVSFSHGNCSDLDITLTAPDGTDITLTSDNAGSNNNVFFGTTFADDADPGSAGVRNVTNAVYTDLVAKEVLTPEEPLGALRNHPANGVWTLRIDDDAVSGSGLFFGWALTLTTCSCEASCPGDTNGDGVTNVDDLLGVITGWGACP